MLGKEEENIWLPQACQNSCLLLGWRRLLSLPDKDPRKEDFPTLLKTLPTLQKGILALLGRFIGAASSLRLRYGNHCCQNSGTRKVRRGKV